VTALWSAWIDPLEAAFAELEADAALAALRQHLADEALVAVRRRLAQDAAATGASVRSGGPAGR
jgi:hypothetical protein